MKHVSTDFDVFLMPVDFIWKYREFDRCGSDNIYGDEYIDELTEDIEKNGVKTTLELQIYGDKALLVEGNHRLCIAKKLGIKELYVWVNFRAFGSINEKKAKTIDYVPSKWRKGIFN